jgi:hypothetical protein
MTALQRIAFGSSTIESEIYRAMRSIWFALDWMVKKKNPGRLRRPGLLESECKVQINIRRR